MIAAAKAVADAAQADVDELESSDDAHNLAIYFYSFGNSFANASVTINGGTFAGNVAFGAGYYADQETVVIKGGVFNGYVGRYLANDGWEYIDVE